MALNFVKQNKNIDKIVIGAESKLQLEENISVIRYNLDTGLIKSVKEINVIEKELLNPTNWN